MVSLKQHPSFYLNQFNALYTLEVTSIRQKKTLTSEYTKFGLPWKSNMVI